MNCRIVLIGVIILSSSVPVNAQFQWPQWPFGGGWEQPQYQQRSETRRERRSHTRHHHSDPKPQPKPKVEYRTRTVTIVKTWNDMSQDKARDWIREQVQSFCGKFPKDVACQRPKEE